MDDPHFNLGRHEALIERLVAGQEQLVADVGEIKTTLAEQRGERRFMAGVWGVAGGGIVAVAVAALKGLVGIHHS